MANRARRQAKAEQIGNFARTQTADSHTHAGAISLSFSLFSCGAEEMASTRFPRKKTCTLLFAKIHAAIVPGLNYATLIAPSFEMHSATQPSGFGGGGRLVSKKGRERREGKTRVKTFLTTSLPPSVRPSVLLFKHRYYDDDDSAKTHSLPLPLSVPLPSFLRRRLKSRHA